MTNVVRVIGLALALAAAAASTGCESTPETPVERAKKAVDLYKEGVARFQADEVDAGIELLKESKRLQPTYTQMRLDLGRMLLFRALRTDQRSIIARAEADRLQKGGDVEAARAKEEEAKLLNRAAWGDLADARSDLEYAAGRVTPDKLPNVYYYLCQVYTGLDMPAEALEKLESAVSTAKAQGIKLERLSQEDVNRIRELLIQAVAQQEQADRRAGD